MDRFGRLAPVYISFSSEPVIGPNSIAELAGPK
jgi:hypothetical protein